MFFPPLPHKRTGKKEKKKVAWECKVGYVCGKGKSRAVSIMPTLLVDPPTKWDTAIDPVIFRLTISWGDGAMGRGYAILLPRGR